MVSFSYSSGIKSKGTEHLYRVTSMYVYLKPFINDLCGCLNEYHVNEQ